MDICFWKSEDDIDCVYFLQRTLSRCRLLHELGLDQVEGETI
jgi:hypothetical protein